MSLITIGFTESDSSSNYSSFIDGYKPGAAQRILVIEVDDALMVHSAATVAEAVFYVTNTQSPGATNGLTRAIYEAIYHPILAGHAEPIRSLSVGDTVTALGESLECVSMGFRPVEIVPEGQLF
jgi:hypothetical protein